MGDLKAKVIQYLLSRLEIDEEDAGILADDMLAVYHEILSGAGSEDVLAHIENFLIEFKSGIRFTEHKPVPRSRRNSYAEKRRTQLDFFAAPSDQSK